MMSVNHAQILCIASLAPSGVDKHGFGFGGTGKKSHSRNFEDYGEAFGLGDTIGCLLDLDSRTVAWRYKRKKGDVDVNWTSVSQRRPFTHLQQKRQAPGRCLSDSAGHAAGAALPGLHTQERRAKVQLWS